MLNKILSSITKMIDLSGRMSCFFIVILTLLVSFSVLLRYVFSIGFIWLQDLYIWVHCLFILLGICYTLYKDEHVRIDIIYRNLSKRKKRFVNIIGYLIFCVPFTFILLTSGYDYFLRSFLLDESSKETGGLPNIFILKFFIFFLGILFILEIIRFLINFVRSNGNS